VKGFTRRPLEKQVINANLPRPGDISNWLKS
jgi:hypothetical protein